MSSSTLSLAISSFLLLQNSSHQKPSQHTSFRHLMCDSNIDKIEQQYRNILFVSWSEEDCFAVNDVSNNNQRIPSDTAAFWAGVATYRNSLNERPFYELAIYCLSSLCVPVSNAVVERTFSIVTAIKTKTRNRMSLRTLDAILRIKLYFLKRGKCCRDFVVTPGMIKRCTVDMTGIVYFHYIIFASLADDYYVISMSNNR